jgi:dTDP-4-dehydrorhamnose 3,5-epimerase
LNFIPQSIPDVLLIEPEVHCDSRGYFTESFRQDLLDDFLGYQVNFIQDNESKSSKGVLRGLHYQLSPYAQTKLVRVIKGKVLDVAVDIRQASPTFGQYVSTELSSDNHRQFFIPRGFAHGFVVLSKSAVFAYKVDNYYSPDDERGIAFNDENIGIDWMLKIDELQLSDKDKSYPTLSEAKELFD